MPRSLVGGVRSPRTRRRGAIALAVTSTLFVGALLVAVRTMDPMAGEAPPVTIGFVPYWDQELALEEVERYADQLSTVSPWWFAPTADGRVVQQHEEYTDVDLTVVRELQRQGKRVMPSVANHREGSWDFEVVGELLSDPEAVDAHVVALTELVVDGGFDGIQFDYENLEEEDAVPYADLVRRTADAFHEHDKVVAVAVHAQRGPEDTGGWGAGHDHERLGRHADELHLMAYDYHSNTSDPGPSAPLWWVEEALGYTTSVVPSEKVVLGLGVYGYDWGEGEVAEGITLQEARTRIRRYSGEGGFDRRSGTPFFTYRTDGRVHELWYEDARSLRSKLDLVTEYDLGGAFVWRMGGTTVEVWEAIADGLDLPPP